MPHKLISKRDMLNSVKHLQNKTITGVTVESNDQIDFDFSDNTHVNFNVSSNSKWINELIPSIGIYDPQIFPRYIPDKIQAMTVTTMGRKWGYIMFYLSHYTLTIYFDRSLIRIQEY